MNSSEKEREPITDVKNQDVDIPQLASSTSNSSGSRTRCGSDGTSGSGESSNISGHEDSSDNTSLGDEEGVNDAGDSKASETKIASVGFDDEDGSHNHDVRRLIMDGDHKDGEVADDSADANVRIGQMGQKTAQKVDHTKEISAVKQVSHLIRSVEIDALCLWDGDGQNGPVTDTRIMMVVCIMISLLTV